MTAHETAARRRDRAVDDEAWIRAFLTSAPSGMLAVEDAGRPYINPNLFVYDAAAHAVYVHTAREGRLRRASDGPRPACFAASEMGRILPAKRAVGFSVEYAGVLVFGTLDVVHDPTEARRALEALVAKYAPHLRPGADYEGVSPEDLTRTSVYRLRVEAWSGKRNQAAPGFPGAFRYGQRPPPAQLQDVSTP